jgi:hypothetical protein
LLGLGIAISIRPRRAEQFLGAYASTAGAHFTEQAVRLVIGFALVILYPSMGYSNILTRFGLIIILTTLELLLIPWKWHYKFGEWVIPPVIRYVKIYSIGVFVLGIFLLFSLSNILF